MWVEFLAMGKAAKLMTIQLKVQNVSSTSDFLKPSSGSDWIQWTFKAIYVNYHLTSRP